MRDREVARMTSPSEIFDQLALDVANGKLTLAGAFNVAYLKGYEHSMAEAQDENGA